MEAIGHRVKRIKTESRATVEVVSRLEGQERAALDRPAQASAVLKDVAAEETERVPAASSIMKPISRAKSSSAQELGHVNTGEMKSTSKTSQNRSHPAACTTPRESAEAPNIDIDFLSAPSDPLYLSFWVAHQIRRFATVDGSGSDVGSGHDESRRSSQSHPPGRHIREKSDHGVDAAIIAEREKLRDGNRKRKQSWRNTHLERSTSLLRFSSLVSDSNLATLSR